MSATDRTARPAFDASRQREQAARSARQCRAHSAPDPGRLQQGHDTGRTDQAARTRRRAGEPAYRLQAVRSGAGRWQAVRVRSCL